jgi:uncharacterized protein YceH (UPF0502 family)
MAELLLRGEQTAGELRTRASRFEPIADLQVLHEILENLGGRGLVVPLTGPGRGQLFTHSLYSADELERLKADVESAGGSAASKHSGRSTTTSATSAAIESLRQEVADLRLQMEEFTDRLRKLEG